MESICHVTTQIYLIAKALDCVIKIEQERIREGGSTSVDDPDYKKYIEKTEKYSDKLSEFDGVITMLALMPN